MRVSVIYKVYFSLAHDQNNDALRYSDAGQVIFECFGNQEDVWIYRKYPCKKNLIVF